MIPSPPQTLSLASFIAWSLVALASFHAAHTLGLGWLLIPCAYALIELSRASTRRKVFYPMLALGFLFYAPQLGFFWGIFGAAAIALWLVLAFWIALFGLTLRLVRLRFGEGWMLALAPFIWTGLEYFRSELYYLRFGWLTFGMANHNSASHAAGIGVFGFAFCCVASAAIAHLLRILSATKRLVFLVVAIIIAVALVLITPLDKRVPETSSKLPHVKVAGVQLEFPNDNQVLGALNQTRAKFPNTQLFMLSEYTFQNPVPQTVRDWCASNQVYLVVGGRSAVRPVASAILADVEPGILPGGTASELLTPSSKSDPSPPSSLFPGGKMPPSTSGQRPDATPQMDAAFYNTAFVVGTSGSIVFQQVKSVPIQFFKDGLPAPDRKVWDSPWGKVGVLTCYDLSYTRVVDDFVRQGAIALLNPTMDVADWGEQQHRLHARVAPMRAAEYGIPIFRVASSGVSQLVSRTGRVLASAPFQDKDYSGDGEIIGGQLPLNARPRLPLDRWLAPGCVGIAALALLASLIPFRRVPPHPNPLPPGEGTASGSSQTPQSHRATAGPQPRSNRRTFLPLPAGEGRGEGESAALRDFPHSPAPASTSPIRVNSRNSCHTISPC
jgi:apolipoprotein N-acyltransferase